MIVVHKDLDHVMIYGSVEKKITWDEYNREGLWTVKKHCNEFDLEAVVFNPNLKTLEKHGITKTIIKKVIKAKDLIDNKGTELAKTKIDNPKSK